MSRTQGETADQARTAPESALHRQLRLVCDDVDGIKQETTELWTKVDAGLETLARIEALLQTSPRATQEVVQYQPQAQIGTFSRRKNPEISVSRYNNPLAYICLIFSINRAQFETHTRR